MASPYYYSGQDSDFGAASPVGGGDDDDEYDFDDYADDDFETDGGSASLSPRSPRQLSPREWDQDTGQIGHDDKVGASTSTLNVEPEQKSDPEPEPEPEPEPDKTKYEAGDLASHRQDRRTAIPRLSSTAELMINPEKVDGNLARMARRTSVYGNVRTFESLLARDRRVTSDLKPASDIAAPGIGRSRDESSASTTDESSSAASEDHSQPKVSGVPRPSPPQRQPAAKQNKQPASYIRRTRPSRRFVQPKTLRARHRHRSAGTTPADVAAPILHLSARKALEWLDDAFASKSGKGRLATRSVRLNAPSYAERKASKRGRGRGAKPAAAVPREAAEHWYNDSDILDFVVSSVSGEALPPPAAPPSPVPSPGEYASEKKSGGASGDAEAFEKCYFKFMRHVADFSMRSPADADDFEMRRRVYEGARKVLLDPANLQRMRDVV